MKMKKNNTGIEFFVQEKEQEKESRVYLIINFLLECICVTLLIYGVVCGLFASCGVPQHKKLVLASIFLMASVTLIIFSLRKAWGIFFAYLISVLGFVLMEFDTIWIGVKYFLQYYLKYANDYFGMNLIIRISEEERQVREGVSLFLVQIVLCFILVFLIETFRKIYKKALIALISPISVFSLIFVVGLVPESQYLFAFLIGFLPLAFPTREKHSMLEIQTKVLISISAGMVAVIFMFVLPKTVYQAHKESIISIKEDIQSSDRSRIISFFKYYLSDRGDFHGGIFTNGYGGKSRGVLGTKDRIEFDKKTDFVFTISKDEIERDDYAIYLRSFVGSTYKNRKWDDLETEQKKEYEKLRNKFHYDFESLSTDAEVLSCSFIDGKRYKPEERNMYFQINKLDVGRKHMLLPYTTQGKVKLEKCLVYTKEGRYKKAYSDTMTQGGLMSLYNDMYNGVQSMGEVLRYQYNASGEEDDFSVYLGDVYDGENIEEKREFQKECKKELDKFVDKELNYRKFVYHVYTKVPEDIAPQLKKNIKQNLKNIQDLQESDMDMHLNLSFALPRKVRYEDAFDDLESVRQIDTNLSYCKDYLDVYTDYSLSPGRTPEGKDFIDYFLYENQKGYCTYYATAAVIYLRLLGVPARYAEGYKITSYDLKKGQNIKSKGKNLCSINVADTQAHAWVEVYINGYGWIPYEVTPGRGYEGVSTEEAMNMHTASPSKVPASPKPSQKTPAPSVKADTPQPSKKAGSTASDGDGKGIIGKEIGTVLMWCGLILMAVMVLWLRKFLIKRRKAKQEFHKENSERVKYYYHELDRITGVRYKKQKKSELWQNKQEVTAQFASISVEEFELFITIVEKATFSNKPVSDYECTKCKILYENVRKELYETSSLVKRIYYEVCRVF